MAAKRVAADLEYASNLARTSSASQKVEFKANKDEYKFPGVPDLRDPSKDYKIELDEAPYHTSIVSAKFGGDNKVTFNGYGTADSGGTVVVTCGSYQKSVVLNAETGKAEVQ